MSGLRLGSLLCKTEPLAQACGHDFEVAKKLASAVGARVLTPP